LLHLNTGRTAGASPLCKLDTSDDRSLHGATSSRLITITVLRTGGWFITVTICPAQVQSGTGLVLQIDLKNPAQRIAFRVMLQKVAKE
jgi:hypothetical protein